MTSVYLTQQEASEFLKCKSVDTFRAFAKRVGLRSYKPCGRLLYRESDIDSRGQARIGIDAPNHVPVHRED